MGKQITNTCILNYESLNIIHKKIRALKHKRRIFMLSVLAEKPMTVTQLVVKTRIDQPVISQHLKILRSEKIVKTKRYGKNILYSINWNELNKIVNIEYISSINRTQNDIITAMESNTKFIKNII